MPSHLQETESPIDWRSYHLGDAEYDIDDDDLDAEDDEDDDDFDDDEDDEDDED